LKEQLKFNCCNQHLVLHYKRAVFWVEQKILLLADLHLGKDAHFRKAGIAIPQVITNEDLRILQELINDFQPKRVFFLGDLFHSVYNQALLSFQHFLKANNAIEFVLIKGNHDVLSQTQLEYLGLSKVYDEYVIPPFSFSHYPICEVVYYNFCGHLHPGIIIKGKAKQGISLPIFYFGKHQATLPAFASFSGKFIVKPTKGDTVFGLTDEGIFEV